MGGARHVDDKRYSLPGLAVSITGSFRAKSRSQEVDVRS